MRWLLSILVAAVLSSPLTLLAAEETLPRYELRVGRKLTYAVSSEMKGDPRAGMGTHSNAGTFIITALRENPDGSRRVTLRSATTFTMTNQGQAHAQPERVIVAYADVFPDGRITPNPTINMAIEPRNVLPLLPADGAQIAKGWAHKNDATMEQTNYTADPKAAAGAGDAGAFVFVGEQAGVMNKIYDMTSHSTFHFDRSKGCVASVKTFLRQGYGIQMSGMGKTTLQADETVPAAELAALAADFDVVIAARKEYQDVYEELSRTPDKSQELLDAAKARIVAQRAAAKTDAGRNEFDTLLKDHDQSAKYALGEAERVKDVINKPAPGWTSTDMDGRPTALVDYRGKVVVMDFWYRGCGWCIYAMPQVMQLANDYAGKPVVVLGMNTDQKESDARFVIDALGLKYPTIKAEQIPTKYGVQAFPTLIIVDKEGIVRDIHRGYSPTLREDVAKKVDELLKELPKAGGE
jgi:thiol-disulfide isomerase/thioredoxin